MQIRFERPEDADSIGRVTTNAFANAPHRGGNEARIIDALRQAGALPVSLVAVDDDGTIIGHVAFSPVQVDRRSGNWFGLGPVSVAPPLQGCGTGRALILEGLDRLRSLGAEGCVVLGDPAYYARFGFRCDPALTYLTYPNPHFQRLVLQGDPPRGDVSYHPAFEVD